MKPMFVSDIKKSIKRHSQSSKFDCANSTTAVNGFGKFIRKQSGVHGSRGLEGGDPTIHH